ncbi:MAG: hypothetical protein Q9200_003255 [Gallowayella weberi]
MSFGWSVSDVASLVQLAYRTAQGARAACGQYDELTRETSSLHIVLNRLHLEVAKPGNPINKQRGIGSYAQDFESIATGCEEALTLLDKILVKYSALSEQERSVRKLWQKVKFGNGAIINVAELKSKVAYYTSALSLFLNLVAVGTVGDVELKMDQAGGDLKEIKAAVNHITAHLLATERKEGSVLTAYTNDDKDAWRELRRGLLRAGFRGSLVRKHMDTIMAYVKELGDEGVLDDIKTDEPASPLLEGYQGESSPLEGIQHLRSHTLDPDWQPGGDDLKGRPLQSSTASRQPTPSLPTTSGDSGKNPDRPKAKNKRTREAPRGAQQRDQDKKRDRVAKYKKAYPGIRDEPGRNSDISDMLEFVFVHPDILRYQCSWNPGPPSKDIIFCDDTELPRFIADGTIIYEMDATILGRELFERTNLGLVQQITLSTLVQTFQIRLLYLRKIDKCVPNFESDPEILDFIGDAGDIFLHRRLRHFPSAPLWKSAKCVDDRQIATLCSMFGVDLIRTINGPSLTTSEKVQILSSIMHALSTWIDSFDRRFPELLEQHQFRYESFCFKNPREVWYRQSGKISVPLLFVEIPSMLHLQGWNFYLDGKQFSYSPWF